MPKDRIGQTPQARSSHRVAPKVAAQILVYPRLDDRNTKPDSEIAPFLTWNWDDNMAHPARWMDEAMHCSGIDLSAQRRIFVGSTRGGRPQLRGFGPGLWVVREKV